MMVRIQINIRSNASCVYSVEEGTRTSIYNLIRDDLELIYRNAFPVYENDELVVDYWFEYEGSVIDEKMEFVCNCPMTIDMKFQMVRRDELNTNIPYDTEKE